MRPMVVEMENLADNFTGSKNLCNLWVAKIKGLH